MVKFKKGLLSIICTLMIMLMIPFSISANGSLSAPFIGYNVYIYDYDSMNYVQTYTVDLDDSNFKMTCTNMLSSGGCNTYQQTSNGDTTGTITVRYAPSVNNTIYKADIILDSNYVGYVNITAFGQTKNWFVNGNMITFNWTDSQSTSQTITINSYSLNKLEEGHTWLFPIESYSIVQSMFSNGFQLVDLYNSSQWTFPIFTQDNSKYIINYNIVPNNSYYIIFITSNASGISNVTQFSRKFSYNPTLSNFETLNVSREGRLVRVTFTNDTSSTIELALKFTETNTDRFIPIYSGNVKNRYISTDFALQFGLRNDLLDAMVYGNDSSIQSSSNLDDSTSDLTQNIGQYTQIENDFNDDMNSHLNNIDTTTNLPTAMGSKFLTSANWVRVQFNRMTDNTPFGSILGFSLVLGLALLIIGKVYK